jgi:hypothetical protein
MVGPRYRKLFNEWGGIEECLVFTCTRCGYEEERPCLDRKEMTREKAEQFKVMQNIKRGPIDE